MTSALTTQELVVDFQNALSEQENAEVDEPPSLEQFVSWARSAYVDVKPIGCERPQEITIRLVDEAEIRDLNNAYRGKDRPTNVLSFPTEMSDHAESEISQEMDADLLGDILICHAVIVREAAQQAKSVHDHYAHMTVHGLLHLCGHDHQDDLSAEQMEALETRILAQHNIADPYQ